MLSSHMSRIPVLIFDEIDAGISGVTGEILANKLRVLSASVQVMCVTHLTQIAGKADCHFSVRKAFDEDKTHIEVTKLDTEGRIREISRMFGNTDSSVAIKHAKEILNIED